MVLVPQGPGLTLLSVSITFLALSWVFVAVRFAVRYRKRCIGADDWLMAAGLVLFTIQSVTTIEGAYNGVGARDYRLTPELNKKGRKRQWFLLFQLFYVTSTVPIKGSICVMLLRITPFTVYQRILHGVMAFSLLSALIVDIAFLTRCQPISATWDPKAGRCANQSVVTSISYFISASTIVTDWSCSILPIFILRHARMPRRMKASIGIILALGAVASTANIVRFKYVLAYEDTVDYLYGIADIATWSMVESGTGIVAGSLPPMAPLIKHIPIIGVGFANVARGQDTINFGSTNLRQLDTSMHTIENSSALPGNVICNERTQ
ncbi:unnamed protein product [Clonostachys rhizophaga]|uniref:Rhodopsin domain-containing protein n=1 Tax=Clonostachys rhizophaga TaxID=160324 RepID=A0A9N9VGR9_9HYPO|nr:unnamed protein product [Clonostachys rhizophaga]